MVSSFLKGLPNLSKSFISKINVAYSNTNLFSLHYKPWYIRYPDIVIIRGIFRTLEYSKVQQYLGPYQTYIL